MIGGSGSVGHPNSNQPGGGGGGAILIASSSRVTIAGGISARGACGLFKGSGGAIRIVAPVVDGNGFLDVSRCDGFSGNQNGRTRIDSLDRFAYRNITMHSKATRGSQMFVFPSGNPRLDIISAAGTAIPEGANAPVMVTLPVGSPTTQIVRVQARGFTNKVDIRVKITPENGTSATFDGTIEQTSGNPPFADVQVTLPVDTVCHVHAWTR